jgi:hypothetical protein
MRYCVSMLLKYIFRQILGSTPICCVAKWINANSYMHLLPIYGTR